MKNSSLRSVTYLICCGWEAREKKFEERQQERIVFEKNYDEPKKKTSTPAS